jgi:hypothetical protein
MIGSLLMEVVALYKLNVGHGKPVYSHFKRASRPSKTTSGTINCKILALAKEIKIVNELQKKFTSCINIERESIKAIRFWKITRILVVIRRAKVLDYQNSSELFKLNPITLYNGQIVSSPKNVSFFGLAN